MRLFPGPRWGLVTPDDLEALAGVARKYNIPVIKITSGQRFALVGLKQEDVDSIWQELGMDRGQSHRVVPALCSGLSREPRSASSRFRIRWGSGTEIEAFFTGMDLPAKVKIGISGCPFCCGESFVRDIGILGKKKRLDLYRRRQLGQAPPDRRCINRESFQRRGHRFDPRRTLEYYRRQIKKKTTNGKIYRQNRNREFQGRHRLVTESSDGLGIFATVFSES